MFNKILIANRGEIACRVIKTAKRMGIQTVAVYSDADKNSMHVNMADEAIYIGASPSSDSYLRSDKIIAAALKTGAQAIHPGYGFLSENAEFCHLCKQKNIVFIGPPVEAIEAMGSKSAAKSIMEKANVPLVPGYHGDDQSAERLKQVSDDMGYPVLLKAAAGGGGKGMRQVWSESEFAEGFAAAKREALSSFGDDTMLVEKYLTQPRHVEIQVFCDNHKNAVYLFERDCSVQRRHQKVIEEAPAFAMPEELRKQMGEAAIKSAKAIGYQGAGTVEFLLDSDGSFYFMEMNTRLQVEHPVTEYITGQDLVEWQLRVAANETLPKTQEQLHINGHAFEARIYAEDPNNDFLPATGHLSYLKTPEESEHVRVDTGVRQGDDVSVYYDPMIAKLVVWDEDRNKALQRLTKALKEYRINGVTTNIDFLYNLATSNNFINENIDTGYIDKNQQDIFHQTKQTLDNELPIAALALLVEKQLQSQQNAVNSNDSNSPWHQTNNWRLNQANQQMITLKHFDGGEPKEFDVTVTQQRDAQDSYYLINVGGSDKQLECHGYMENDKFVCTVDGYQSTSFVVRQDNDIKLYRNNGVFHFQQILPDLGLDEDHGASGGLTAPMNGTMVSVLVKAGDTVEKDQALVIMEAMKMEHTIRAPEAGKVSAVFFNEGDLVDGGVELLSIEPEE